MPVYTCNWEEEARTQNWVKFLPSHLTENLPFSVELSKSRERVDHWVQLQPGSPLFVIAVGPTAKHSCLQGMEVFSRTSLHTFCFASKMCLAYLFLCKASVSVEFTDNLPCSGTRVYQKLCRMSELLGWFWFAESWERLALPPHRRCLPHWSTGNACMT